jgi:hypothetical protein
MFIIVGINQNYGNLHIVTKYPMKYEDAVAFIAKCEDRPNIKLTLAEVF